jgi:hypothetical protein
LTKKVKKLLDEEAIGQGQIYLNMKLATHGLQAGICVV